MAKGIRVNELAKELGVESKAILAKCHEEGLGYKVPNHMVVLSVGLAETVREWFSGMGGGGGTAVEVAPPVEVRPRRPRVRPTAGKTEVRPASVQWRYTVKLILVGEPKAGKTSLVAALAGQPFVENRITTHGIDVRSIQLPHPENSSAFTFNVWDFGGQAIYRVTHQFFYSPNSIYLLLWDSRMNPDIDGWMRRIRLRVGESGKIIVVATQCDSSGHIPRVETNRLQAEYGGLIVGFHEVDSKTGKGISELKSLLALTATTLPQTGFFLSDNWNASRDEVLARPDPYIAYSTFSDVCEKYGLDADATSSLAAFMHVAGQIVHFGDDEGLKDVVILQPDWVSKAVGFVLEDRQTERQAGVLDHARLKTIWHDRVPEGQAPYDLALHPFFLSLMEKFEVSYRLADEDKSLVPQLVPDMRPALSWSATSPLPPGIFQISLACDLGEEPPPGLVALFNVRTHHLCTTPDMCWKTGLLLQHPKLGEALVELAARELLITVRAEWPAHFMHILRETLERLIEQRWPGLERIISIPCPALTGGRLCKERFRFDMLQNAMETSSTDTVHCNRCSRDHSISQLITGVIESPINAVHVIQRQVELLSRAICSETRDGPSSLTLVPVDWDLVSRLKVIPLFTQVRYRLTLWCDCPDGPHPVCPIGSGAPEIGEYTFERHKVWFVKVAPYARRYVARILKIVAPHAETLLKETIGSNPSLGISETLDRVAKWTEPLTNLEAQSGPSEVGEHITTPEGVGLRELHGLLRELDPTSRWGGLRRVFFNPSGKFLWLCPAHYDQYAQRMSPDLPYLEETRHLPQ